MSIEQMRKKWFQGQGERQADVDRALAIRGMWSDWIKTRGYKEFKVWLDQQMELNEVDQGSEATMTVQVGIRRGLRTVMTQLRDIERIATEEP